MPFYRVIKTGNVLEIYEYERTNNYTYEQEIAENTGEKKEGLTDQARKDLYNRQSANRSRQNIRRLILNNFNDDNTFITLTFAENMTDVNKANYELKKFVQKMKRKQSDFKHVTVIEFQERGAVHYHMICNYVCDKSSEEAIKKEETFLGKKVWKNGFVDLKNISGIDNVGAYVIKYMTKGKRDSRLFEQKSYFTGGDLERPQFITDQELVALYVNSFEGQVPSFTSEYETEYTGKVFYREFNLERIKKMNEEKNK